MKDRALGALVHNEKSFAVPLIVLVPISPDQPVPRESRVMVRLNVNFSRFSRREQSLWLWTNYTLNRNKLLNVIVFITTDRVLSGELTILVCFTHHVRN